MAIDLKVLRYEVKKHLRENLQDEQKVCSKCLKIKSYNEFSPGSANRDGHSSWCKQCSNDHRVRSRGTVEGKRKRRDGGLRRWYGITIEEFDAMLESANYKCEVCREPGDIQGLHLDHNHVTNEVRGILCGNCNRALGNAKDSIEILEKLIEYVKTRS